MTESAAAELLKAIFTDRKWHFLLAHPKFKEETTLAREDCFLAGMILG